MPSRTSASRRRRQVIDTDSDDDTSARPSRHGTPFSQTSDGSKRMRLEPRDRSGGGEEGILDGGDKSSEESPSPQSGTNDGHSRPRPLLSSRLNKNHSKVAGNQNTVSAKDRGLDEYRAGSIVRVKLTDFVTYTSAEFFPGPKLNMVIGPNGTGKSTLVCAICLGLGWGPQHLGRAKDASEFVKHGCREATIEIELAAAGRYRRNPVICRTIKREGNKSSFTVNGRPSTKHLVLELAQSFSIQIDNLCQFLPQDKVSEFAALSPVELLHSTQRAAAGPEMIEWHESLKKLRTEQKRLQASHSSDKELLSNLENRQEMQRADVERMRQRVEIKKRIELLEMSRPIPKYRESHEAFKTARQKKLELERELGELKSQLEPTLRAVNAKQDYCVKIDAVVKQKRQIVNRADALATESAGNMSRVEDKMKDLNSQIEAEKKTAQAQREGYKKLQQNINKLKRQIEDEPMEFDAAAYTEKIRDKLRLIREIEGKARDVQERKKTMIDDVQERKSNIQQAEERLRNLESQVGQQEAKLQKMSNDSYRAWQWIKENQHQFENQVFGPPIIECSIDNPRYADAIETLFQKNDLIAFTAQSRNDFRKLQRALCSERKFHDISIRTCSTPLSDFHPPIPDGQLRALGFDGWAKDFLTGPDPVLAMLCSENRLHLTPLRLRDISDEEFSKMESGPISSWVAGRQSYQVIRRREYGPSATSTRVRQLRPARIWTSQPVDNAAQRDLGNNISEWKRELVEIGEQMDADKAVLARLFSEREEATRQKVELEHEKSGKQTALMNWKALPTKLAQQEEKRRSMDAGHQAIKKRVEAIRNKQDRLSIERAAGALEYANAVEALGRLHEDLVRSEINYIEAVSDYETLKERNGEVNETLKTKTVEVKESVRELKTAADQCTKFRQNAELIITQAGRDPALNDVLHDIKEHSIEQLEADIDSEKARLELTHDGSASVIQEFEERQRRIDKLKEQLSEFQKSLDELDDAIAEVRSKWEPKLDSLVQKISSAFSDSFARIGCAGQVSVDKAEDNAIEPGNSCGRGVSNVTHDRTQNSSDFDQWSIRIQVKFREQESLSVLDSHRQSGGERAVSTIFYLMALQSLSASPFRVVDEINQGMDPRNERMVHERMVDIACSPDGGQYFLITPKLLNGLVYKRGMRVLCIVSGEYVPEEYAKVDFGRCVLRMKDLISKRAASSRGGGVGGVGDAFGSRTGDVTVDIGA